MSEDEIDDETSQLEDPDPFKELHQRKSRVERSKPTFKGKLPRISQDSSTLAADIVYNANRAEYLARTHEENSVYGALEQALPSAILRRHNPRGDATLSCICTSLKNEFNSASILYQECQDLNSFRIDEGKGYFSEILRFTSQVAEFNIRCQQGGPLFIDKVWNMQRVLDHITGLIVDGDYRADFTGYVLERQRTKPLGSWLECDIREILTIVEAR
jgi:hypothetical protein